MFRDIKRRNATPDIIGAEVEVHNYDGHGRILVSLPIQIAQQIAEGAVANGGSIQLTIKFDGTPHAGYAIAGRVDDYENPRAPNSQPVHDDPPLPAFGNMRTIR